METRVCNVCNVEKEITLFTSQIRSGIRKYFLQCKECYSRKNTAAHLKKKLKDPEFKKRHELKKKKKELELKGLKECKTCLEIKKINEFPDGGKRADNTIIYKNDCKVCYYEKHKKKILKRGKERYRENPEKKLKQNKERWLEQNKQPDFKEKEKERYKEYYEREKKKIFAKQIIRRKTSWKYNLSGRIRGRLSFALKQGGYSKKSSTNEILGADWNTIKVYIESQFLKGMNWDNRDKWEIDHIVPLSSAINEDEMYALAHYKNLQPLWEDENLMKSDNYDPKDKEEYLEWYSKNVAQK